MASRTVVVERKNPQCLDQPCRSNLPRLRGSTFPPLNASATEAKRALNEGKSLVIPATAGRLNGDAVLCLADVGSMLTRRSLLLSAGVSRPRYRFQGDANSHCPASLIFHKTLLSRGNSSARALLCQIHKVSPSPHPNCSNAPKLFGRITRRPRPSHGIFCSAMQLGWSFGRT